MNLQDLIKEHDLKEGDEVVCMTLGCGILFDAGKSYPLYYHDIGCLGFIVNGKKIVPSSDCEFSLPEKEKNMEPMRLPKLIEEHDLKDGDEVLCVAGDIIFPTKGEKYKLAKFLFDRLGILVKKEENSEDFYFNGREDLFVIVEKPPHCELKHKWSDGAIIQVKIPTYSSFDWCDCEDNKPKWLKTSEYRVKPKEYNDTEFLDWLLKSMTDVDFSSDENKNFINFCKNLAEYKKNGIFKTPRQAITEAINSEQD